MKQQAILLLIWLLSVSTICLAEPVSTAKELALLDMTLLALTRSSTPEDVEFYKTLVGERFKALERSFESELPAVLEQRKALFAIIHNLVSSRWQNRKAQVVSKNLAPVSAIFLLDDLLAYCPDEHKDGSALRHIRDVMWQAMLKYTPQEPNMFLSDALKADEVLIQQQISRQHRGTEINYLVANLTTKLISVA